MTEVASAYVTLLPSAKGFGRGIDGQISGDIGRSGQAAGAKFSQGMGGVVARSSKSIFAPLLGAVAGVQVVDFLRDSIAEGREAAKVGALTANVIKTTGKAANVSAEQVGKLTGAISEKVGIDDEAIQSGANLLLTFKNVRNEVGQGNKIFDRATQAAVDLSASGFGDLNGAAKQLGKALNDPLKGITALGRAGVTFTDQQKDQIKTLVESGRALDAQKIILQEVESQVGGAATAQATNADKLGVAFGNLKEDVGTALIPALDDLAGFMVEDGIPAARKFGNFFKEDVIPVLKDVGDAVGVVGDAFGSLPGGVQKALAIGAGAAAVGLKVKGMMGGGKGGLLGGVASKGTPLPVFVTNPGFGTGSPGTGLPGGKTPKGGLPSIGLSGPKVGLGVGAGLLAGGVPDVLPKIGNIEQQLKAWKALGEEIGTSSRNVETFDAKLAEFIRSNPQVAFQKMDEAAKTAGTSIDGIIGPLQQTKVAVAQARDESTRKVTPWFDAMKRSVMGSRDQVRGLDGELRTVGRLHVSPTVDVDTSAAQAKIAALKNQISILGGKGSGIPAGVAAPGLADPNARTSITINNPVPERASTSLPRALSDTAYLLSGG